MDIQLDKGLQLNDDDLKKAFRAIGKLFIQECRMLLNSSSISTDDMSKEEQAALPHNITGQLANSLKYSVRSKKGAVWLKISANTRYATALFAGSTRKDGTKVAARPLFDIVMERIKPKINSAIRNAILIVPSKS